MEATFDDFLGSGAELTERPESAYDTHYRAGGFGYDEQREMWAAWVAEHYVARFGLPVGGTLLDVGCGDGFWSGLFHEAGFRVSGFDTSRGGIEVATARYPAVEFAVASLDGELPYPAASFDVVFCRGLTHMCGPDLTAPRVLAAFAALYRLLRPSGVLLVSYFSHRDGARVGATTMHRLSDVIELLERAGGDPFAAEVVQDYMQVAATRAPVP